MQSAKCKTNARPYFFDNFVNSIFVIPTKLVLEDLIEERESRHFDEFWTPAFGMSSVERFRRSDGLCDFQWILCDPINFFNFHFAFCIEVWPIF